MTRSLDKGVMTRCTVVPTMTGCMATTTGSPVRYRAQTMAAITWMAKRATICCGVVAKKTPCTVARGMTLLHPKWNGPA